MHETSLELLEVYVVSSSIPFYFYFYFYFFFFFFFSGAFFWVYPSTTLPPNNIKCWWYYLLSRKQRSVDRGWVLSADDLDKACPVILVLFIQLHPVLAPLRNRLLRVLTFAAIDGYRGRRLLLVMAAIMATRPHMRLSYLCKVIVVLSCCAFLLIRRLTKSSANRFFYEELPY